MGRKGIGRRSKSGHRSRHHPTAKRLVIQPDEGRVGLYQFGAAHKRPNKRREGSPNSESDDDVDDTYEQDSALIPKLTSLVIGNKRYPFSEASCIPSDKEIDVEPDEVQLGTANISGREQNTISLDADDAAEDYDYDIDQHHQY